MVAAWAVGRGWVWRGRARRVSGVRGGGGADVGRRGEAACGACGEGREAEASSEGVGNRQGPKVQVQVAAPPL